MAKEVTQEMIDRFRKELLDSPDYNLVEPQEFSDELLRMALEKTIQEIDNVPPKINLSNYWNEMSELVYDYAWIKLLEMIVRAYARNQALPISGGFPTIEATRLQLYRDQINNNKGIIYHQIEAKKTEINVEESYGHADWNDGVD